MSIADIPMELCLTKKMRVIEEIEVECDFSSVIPDSTHTCSTLNPERYGFLSYVVIKQSPMQIRMINHESI